MKAFYFFFISLIFFRCGAPNIENYIGIDADVPMFPDYSQTIIPPNIAPLNFYIEAEAEAYFVKIYSETGKEIRVFTRKPSICINEKKWKKLLADNKNKVLVFEVYIKKGKQWMMYKRVENYIADTDIESYLAYRLINTGYVLWKKIGIYQRNLTNFDETAIFENSSADEACVNCHSFCKNNPDKMIMHLRSSFAGTVLIDGNTKKKVNTQSKYTMSAGVYPAWHPNGRLVAFSVNKINQYFTSDTSKRIIVSDNASDIVVYDIKTNTITTCSDISTRSRENTPAWSPDGKWLYFVSAPECFDMETRNNTRYSLLRIAFNSDSLSWGRVDTLISSTQTGISFSFPRVSPDGKYVLLSGADYGYFSIVNSKSDLYLFNLETGELILPEIINSEQAESYHDWSETGRWFVFASKRTDGLFSRPYFSYVDVNGNVYKPFVLPQKNPLFYKSFAKNYNVPELISGKVRLSAREMRNMAMQEPVNASFDMNVHINALSGATRISDEYKGAAH
ncbi:MAG: PD40 domain-containing protein [Bacteroidales bacterium]|nr:PD40 domain-containing protein [Bacteroidales bacterium]